MTQPEGRSDRGRLGLVGADAADRLPPQNLEAEKGVIGSILLEPDVADEVMAVLLPRHCYRDSHQVILRHLYEMRSAGEPIDTILLEERLRKAGLLEKVGGLDAILEIVNGVPHSVNAPYYAQVVREKSAARDLIEAARAILRDGHANAFTAAELLGSAGSAVDAVRDDYAGESDGTANAQVAAAEALDFARARRSGRVVGVDTGIDALDRQLGDMLPGEFYVFAARPGHGKSSLGLQTAERCVSLRKKPALYASLEMTRKGLGARLLSLRTGVPGSYFRRPASLTDEVIARLEEGVAAMGDVAGLLIDQTPAVALSAIASVARRHGARHGGLGLVVVDYLQLVQPEDPKASREQQVAQVSRGLRDMAKTLDCAVIALSQLNRKIEERSDKKPQMADLRESGQLEQDADGVVILSRPNLYDRAAPADLAEMHVVKNRAGEQGGTITVGWNGPLTRFENPEEPLPDFDHGKVY